MRLQWGRVLVGGFLIEVLLAIVLSGGFAVAGVDISQGVSTMSAVIIGAGCFAASFLIALWLGRGIHSHVGLHGLLMGLAATVLYVGLVAGSGQISSAFAVYGPVTFVVVNAVRLVGGLLGGIACERRAAARPAMA